MSVCDALTGLCDLKKNYRKIVHHLSRVSSSVSIFLQDEMRFTSHVFIKDVH